MKKYLFIAEKPSAMRAVEDAYKKNRAEIEEKIGAIDFVALAGHVCRYLELKEYKKYQDENGAPTPWRDIVLPIDVEMQVAAGSTKAARERVSAVREKLKKGYDGIIVGTDSDVEGNGIYYLLARHLRLGNYETLRFFEQSLTEKEIVKSLLHMTDFNKDPRDVHMTDSYIVRSGFDWRVGMNATIGFTVKSGALCKVGRVKAPTIKLVCDNSDAIDNFVPHSDFLVRANYREGFSGILSNGTDSVVFDTKAAAEKKISEISEKTASVVDVTREDIKTAPPQFHKLSTLQVEVGKEFGYNPEKTLSIVQELYEKHYVSYPRTDGVYLSVEAAGNLGTYLNNASVVPELSDFIRKIGSADIAAIRSNRRFVNDDEVAKASHTALMPEGKPNYASLSTEEKNVYGAICKRLVAAFLGNLIENKTKLTAMIGGDTFRSVGSRVVSSGWKVLYGSEEKTDVDQIPDQIKKGDVIHVDRFDAKERKASPPKRLTTATLIDAMENISRYIEDKELRKVMRDAKGLGTPATRARIINDIIDAGYVLKKGKNEALYITDAGRDYMKVIGSFSICDPSESARIETMFQSVKEGSKKREDAIRESAEFIKKMTQDISEKLHMTNAIVPCPWCGKDVVRTSWGYGCAGYNDGCRFSVFDKEKKVSAKDIEDLVLLGKTRIIPKICVAKSGKSYDAALALEPKGSERGTKFVFEEKREKLDVNCPWCGSPVESTPWGYRCTGSEAECEFFISNKERKISVNDVADLIKNGRTRIIRKICVSKGRSYDAALVLNPRGSKFATNFEFEDRGGKEIGSDCPWCGASIVKTSKGYRCSGDGCKFYVHNENGTITPDDINDLAKKGKTRMIFGIGKNKKGVFNARLVLNGPNSEYATCFLYTQDRKIVLDCTELKKGNGKW